MSPIVIQQVSYSTQNKQQYKQSSINNQISSIYLNFSLKSKRKYSLNLLKTKLCSSMNSHQQQQFPQFLLESPQLRIPPIQASNIHLTQPSFQDRTQFFPFQTKFSDSSISQQVANQDRLRFHHLLPKQIDSQPTLSDISFQHAHEQLRNHISNVQMNQKDNYLTNQEQNQEQMLKLHQQINCTGNIFYPDQQKYGYYPKTNFTQGRLTGQQLVFQEQDQQVAQFSQPQIFLFEKTINLQSENQINPEKQICNENQLQNGSLLTFQRRTSNVEARIKTLRKGLCNLLQNLDKSFMQYMSISDRNSEIDFSSLQNLNTKIIENIRSIEDIQREIHLSEKEKFDLGQFGLSLAMLGGSVVPDIDKKINQETFQSNELVRKKGLNTPCHINQTPIGNQLNQFTDTSQTDVQISQMANQHQTHLKGSNLFSRNQTQQNNLENLSSCNQKPEANIIPEFQINSHKIDREIVEQQQQTTQDNSSIISSNAAKEEVFDKAINSIKISLPSKQQLAHQNLLIQSRTSPNNKDQAYEEVQNRKESNDIQHQQLSQKQQLEENMRRDNNKINTENEEKNYLMTTNSQNEKRKIANEQTFSNQLAFEDHDQQSFQEKYGKIRKKISKNSAKKDINKGRQFDTRNVIKNVFGILIKYLLQVQIEESETWRTLQNDFRTYLKDYSRNKKKNVQMSRSILQNYPVVDHVDAIQDSTLRSDLQLRISETPNDLPLSELIVRINKFNSIIRKHSMNFIVCHLPQVVQCSRHFVQKESIQRFSQVLLSYIQDPQSFVRIQC